MSRRLADLSERFRPHAIELLARLAEAGIPVLIVDTRRTAEEHARNLQNGTSWVLRSKHLDGDAIDVAPFDVYRLHGTNKLQWSSGDPVWQEIGRVGEAVGLRWGGRWKQKDLGHFELIDRGNGR